MGGGTCLVTVGTTQFDALVEALNEAEAARGLASLLAGHGFARLVVQHGRGGAAPDALGEAARLEGLEFEAFRFSHEFARHIEAASLVISHAGAGSILEGLRARKAMLVVVNETLQENHQVELAEALQERGYLRWAYPHTAVGVLARMFRDAGGALPSPEPFPEADREAFPRLLAAELGF